MNNFLLISTVFFSIYYNFCLVGKFYFQLKQKVSLLTWIYEIFIGTLILVYICYKFDNVIHEFSEAR